MSRRGFEQSSLRSLQSRQRVFDLYIACVAQCLREAASSDAMRTRNGRLVAPPTPDLAPRG
eukprot:CAMPEP_0176270988 /NCGR_PEP_ID=MMETSP0121_2-20121125/44977_1 /TAXON_ID=160619 /ORGANISM="Kryptoperidinium foliaceum, Strain CCMP 1326" /LENGTH=60 /DNA_ID=CAMNT_0017611137 /DNA_START=248 /DNA_END=426 /DNA_ORIENTATION=+